MFGRRTVGLTVGWLADLAFTDPRRGHPVAGFGAAAAVLERVTYRDARWAGAMHAGVLLGAAAVAGVAAERVLGRLGIASATWVALGGTSLLRAARDMTDLLDVGDLEAARGLLPSLCGRDPAALNADGLARAALESLAENTSDAQIAPLLWTAAFGAPGALVYRAVNTLDAMIGYRTPRYGRFGWAAARLDDVANFVPSRVSAVLVVVCAPLVSGSAAGAVRAWRRDAARHPSPNAGVVESAFAGALGVRLGGPTRYSHRLEIRPTLGDGVVPGVEDLGRAIRLSRAVQMAAAVSAIALVLVSGRGKHPRD